MFLLKGNLVASWLDIINRGRLTVEDIIAQAGTPDHSHERSTATATVSRLTGIP